MKVRSIRTLLYEYPLTRPIGDVHLPEGVKHSAEVAVFIDSDEPGLTGVTVGFPAAVAAIGRLEGLIVGEDPRSVTALWHRMMGVAFKAGNAGPIKSAIAAIDCALWDLRSKAHGVPLWKELGGSRASVRAYASGLDTPLSDPELDAYYRGMAARGVTAGKLKVGRDAADDARRLDILASALDPGDGRRPALMVDANEYWTPKQAVQRIRRLEAAHELTWVEEPVPRTDHEGLRRVSDAIDAPVATGENLNDIHDYVPLLLHGAVDVIQMGANTTGITGALQVADLAYGFDRPVAMMNCPGRFMAHVAAALPHHTMMEVLDVGRDAALTGQPPIIDGHIALGDTPGSGIEFDMEKLERLRVESPSANTLRAAYTRAPDAGGIG